MVMKSFKSTVLKYIDWYNRQYFGRIYPATYIRACSTVSIRICTYSLTHFTYMKGPNCCFFVVILNIQVYHMYWWVALRTSRLQVWLKKQKLMSIHVTTVATDSLWSVWLQWTCTPDHLFYKLKRTQNPEGGHVPSGLHQNNRPAKSHWGGALCIPVSQTSFIRLARQIEK